MARSLYHLRHPIANIDLLLGVGNDIQVAFVELLVEIDHDGYAVSLADRALSTVHADCKDIGASQHRLTTCFIDSDLYSWCQIGRLQDWGV